MSNYLTPKEVCAELKISVRTLYNWESEGLVPKPLRLGGKRLWPAQQLHDHVAKSRPGARAR
jgi:excisionase family DNA binding protein